MDEKTIEAYRFIANRALYEIRLFGGPYLQGPPLFAGLLPRHRRQIKFIACFAYVFHNLSLALEGQYMDKFDESDFWKGIDSLQTEFGNLMRTDYRDVFSNFLNDEYSKNT